MKNLFQNTRKPEGLGGRIMLNMMNAGHAMLSKWGLSHIALDREDDVLDVGCGGGANISALLTMCRRVSGLDYSSMSVEKAISVNSVAVASGRCSIVQGDVQEMPFEECSFDAVTAFETVYFWDDMLRSFAEIRRVLKPGGIFLICNESDGTKKSDERWLEKIEGMTIYSSADLSGLLESAGFANIKVYNKKGWICVTARK